MHLIPFSPFVHPTFQQLPNLWCQQLANPCCFLSIFYRSLSPPSHSPTSVFKTGPSIVFQFRSSLVHSPPFPSPLVSFTFEQMALPFSFPFHNLPFTLFLVSLRPPFLSTSELSFLFPFPSSTVQSLLFSFFSFHPSFQQLQPSFPFPFPASTVRCLLLSHL